MKIPKQCRSCGGFCGGGYSTSKTYRPCKNTAHISAKSRYVPMYLLENLLNAYAPNARETMATEGREVMHDAVLAAIDAIDRGKYINPSQPPVDMENKQTK